VSPAAVWKIDNTMSPGCKIGNAARYARFAGKFRYAAFECDCRAANNSLKEFCICVM
jgi:hypothetical protein